MVFRVLGFYGVFRVFRLFLGYLGFAVLLRVWVFGPRESVHQHAL